MKRNSRRKALGIVFSGIILVLILSVLTPTLGIKNKTISGINTNRHGYGYGYDVSCRFTGGGTIEFFGKLRVIHGFELHCNVEELPNNLEVKWDRNYFHMDVLTQVECNDDLSIKPNHRDGCNTIHGWGEGNNNGVSGYNIEFIFTDAGEPGKGDRTWIKITDSVTDTIILVVNGLLKSGNHQAHG